jgi:two-component system response regulator (stage 0 sporulation protein F)
MEDVYMVKKILVVDDEYAIRVLLKNFLEGHDFDVRLAEDGDAAYQTFDEFRPQLIITDIMMPMENGISIVSRIRDIHPSIKVIYLSAWLDEAETEKTLHEELNRYPHYKLIQKPFNLDTLLQTIRDMAEPA